MVSEIACDDLSLCDGASKPSNNPRLNNPWDEMEQTTLNSGYACYNPEPTGGAEELT